MQNVASQRAPGKLDSHCCQEINTDTEFCTAPVDNIVNKPMAYAKSA